MPCKFNFLNRALSAFLCICLLLAYLPFLSVSTSAISTPFSSTNKVTDAPTVNGYQEIFGTASTENSGGVWTDKSVFKNVADYINATSESENYTPNMLDEENNFLIALSAMASNKQVVGYSTAPTDTILVLDMSSSMQGSNYNSILPLAKASNSAIKELLTPNKNNRVGVVLYSGSDENSGTLQTRVLLPLDRYTPNEQGDYIEYTTINGEEGIRVASGVKNSKNETQFGLAYNQSTWSSGTFTQDGIYVATEMLLAAEQYVEGDNVQAGMERMPIMVLMTDGEPSLLSTDFAEGTYDYDDGLKHMTSNFTGGTYHTGADTEFMVQLTAAYAKYRIDQKYDDHDLKFYSLGLMGNSNFATTILDPANHTATDPYWQNYLDDSTYKDWVIYNERTGNRYQITTSDEIRAELKAAVTSTAAEDLRTSGLNKYRYYIDKYFEATDDTVVDNAFKEIAAEIIEQSRYYPTLVEDDQNINHGGYLTIVDTLGKYMEVKDIKNIQLGGMPFYGKNAAKSLAELTTSQSLTEMQEDLLEAVMERLGVDSATALEAIAAAQESGVLYYNEDSFSNAIGWYGYYDNATVNPTYIGPWNGESGGKTPRNANCTIKSYYFYGQGVNDTQVCDMRYIEVAVVNFLATGETKVRVRIPATIIPLTTHEVKLNGDTLDSSVNGITLSGATAPIRVVYEVGLKETINALNVGSVASDAYNETTGKFDFYSNKWDKDGVVIGETPPRTVGNSYAYYEPSEQNEYMYYQQDTLIYEKIGDEYVLYTGEDRPSGDNFYTVRYCYTAPEEGSTSTQTPVYYSLDEAHIGNLKKVEEDGAVSWALPKGSHVFANGAKVINYKVGENEGGNTGTYKTSSTYYINHTSESQYSMEVALGNNGKYSVEALQGVRLQKIVDEDSGLAKNQEYEFTVTPVNGSLSGEYKRYTVDGIDNDGTAGATETTPVTANADGSITVMLKANQTLYIAGLPAGEYTVTEAKGENYILSEIAGGVIASENSTTLTVNDNEFATASFINVARKTGNLTIAKEVKHPYGAEYTVPADKSFDMTVNLMLNDKPLSGKEYIAVQTLNGDVTKVSTDDDGNFSVKLFNYDQIEVFGLPEGTVVTVREAYSNGFTPTYRVNGQGNSESGVVTIKEDLNASVLVVNDYKPEEINNPIVTLTVNLTLTGREWLPGDAFEFELQKWDAENSKWITIGDTKVITNEMEFKTLDFTEEIQSEKYSEIGTYYYRVVELEPENDDIIGVTYDNALHEFSVEITDTKMEGHLKVEDVVKSSGTAPEKVEVSTTVQDRFDVVANFENLFQEIETDAFIEVDKLVVNLSNSPLATPDGFKFEIYSSDAEGNVGDKLEDKYQFAPTTTTGNTRTSIHYTTASLNGAKTATYYYAIKEVEESRTGWTYSNVTQYVTVVLTLEGADKDILVATAYAGLGVSGNGSEMAVVSFTNTYSPAIAELDFEASKTLNGRDMAEGEFAFEIRPYRDDLANNPLWLLDGENLVSAEFLTATNAAAESNDKLVAESPLEFPTVYFNEVGTYQYIARETTTDTEHLKTDKNVYHIYVTVTDIGGKLSAKYHIVDAAGTEIPFVNTYTPPPLKYTVSGTNVLEGRPLENGEITFVMSEAKNEDGETDGSSVTYTTKNSMDTEHTGSFAFPEMEYDKIGTYYYVITELNKGQTINGVTHSDEKYVVKVEVTYDKKTGLFSADISENADEIHFIDIYRPAPTTIDIGGLKALTGNRLIKANDFSFEIKSVTEGYVYSDIVSNDEHGRFVFEGIEFTAAGTYDFEIREVIPEIGAKGFTYDKSYYTLSVTVTDNLKGQLEKQDAVLERNTDEEGKQSAIAIAFYNEYKADNASLKFSGKKLLEGRELLENEFTFLLNAANADFEIDDTVDTVSVTNRADGTFDFGEMQFSEIGTYHYVISEDNTGSLERVDYDDTKYYVTVTVSDDYYGLLVADYTVKTAIDATENANEIVFTNKYTPRPDDIFVDINIDKTVENKGAVSITPEGFEFELLKDGAAEPESVLTDADGNAKFTLSFTEDDIGSTYTYTLTEVNGGLANVKYSTASYIIAITISLDESNKLVASITQNAVSVDSVVAEFVNEYDYIPATPTPSPTPSPSPAPDSPKTGDRSNIGLWLALLLIGCTCLAGTFTWSSGRGRRKNAPTK